MTLPPTVGFSCGCRGSAVRANQLTNARQQSPLEANSRSASQ